MNSQEKGTVGRSRCEAFGLKGTGDTSHSNGCHWKGPETTPNPHANSKEKGPIKGAGRLLIHCN